MNKDRNVVKILNEVVEEICQNYCKYPGTWDEKAEGIELVESDLCKNCPLNLLN